MPKLTIGMAHFKDYYSAYHTIQAIRIYHSECMSECEFVIVDNSAGTAHSKDLLDLVNQMRAGGENVTYFPMTDKTGTSHTRAKIFELATSPAVLVMDCHVHLYPGAIRKLIDWYDAHPGTKDIYSGPLAWDNLKSGASSFKDTWDGQMRGQWDGSLVPLDAAPFETLGMGLGVFSMRKDAFPGFPKGVRGFGGEELCLHDRVRKHGGKSICLPFLRWVHRWGRPDGIPYVNRYQDKAHNYMQWHKEDGGDWLDKCHHEFVGKKYMPQSEWDSIMNEVHMDAKTECKSCNQPRSLDEWYNKASGTPSDINEHCELLKDLASQCDHVVEFGSRYGVSTIAMLMGKPKRMTSYDIKRESEIDLIEKIATETQYRFVNGDSLTADIEECDMLFIDTKHTAQQLFAELNRHWTKVKRWIVMHDTVTFGEFGEGGGNVPGLKPAMREFMKQHPEWSVYLHKLNNNGLTVLTKDPRDKKKLPGVMQMAANFTKSISEYVASGMQNVPKTVLESRLSECTMCELRDGERCTDCGCYMPAKAQLATAFCPLGKWHALSNVTPSGSEGQKN